MRILGVSCDFHDSAAALVVDGEIVAAAEEERFTRVKHDRSLPVSSIASVLAIGGLRPDDLDRVVVHEKPLTTLSRVVATRQRRGPRGLVQFSREFPQLINTNLFVGLRLERALRGLGASQRPNLRYADHHMSHAAAAFYPSPFSAAAVVTLDGIGGWTTTSIGRGVGSRLDLLAERRYPDSLGLFYSLITEFCGFEANSDEYKLMGLAPYGEPTLLDELRSVVEVGPDGSFTIDQGIVGQWAGDLANLERCLGRSRRLPGAPITDSDADLARSAQVLVEETVLAIVDHAHRLTGEKHLCLAGGVALNCVANGRVLREGPFDDVWVQPAAGDAGSAIGSALWAEYAVEGTDRIATPGDSMKGAALGPAFDPDSVAEWLDAGGVPHRRMPDVGDRGKHVAAALADGAYVGWFEGAMEFGPRALGHRSIVADPRSVSAQRDLNLRVKGRESFRPFAPAVLAERASEWFETDRPSEYMLFTADVVASRQSESTGGTPLVGSRASVRTSEIPACTHVDGSARVQTVDRERHDGFRSLIEAFDDSTGCPVLLNTSFNEAGEPIVCTPDDALSTARRIGLDLLVIEECVVAVADLPSEVARGVWPSIPEPPGKPATTDGFLSLLAFGLAVVGPALRAWTLIGPRNGIEVAVALTLASSLLHTRLTRSWLSRLVVIAGASLVAGFVGGVHVGVWAFLAVGAADCVVFARSIVPFARAGDSGALPGVVALGVAATWVGRTAGSEPSLRFVLGLLALLVVASSYLPGHLERLTDRLSAVVGRAIGRSLSWILGATLIVPTWCMHQIVRVNPLRPGGAARNRGWIRIEPVRPSPTTLWRVDPWTRDQPLAWRLRRATGSLIGIALLVAVVALAPRGVQSAPSPVHQNTDPSAIPAAFANSPWFPDYREDIAWLWRTSVAWDPLAPVRLRDVKTKSVEIIDGARVSWEPPDCSCQPIRVWMYGGSTTFGLGQRDEHTIASELARAAWADGVAVDISNRGVVGDHHWEEANRFAWDLATLPAPDLVVFLDGINDVQAVDRMREESRQPLSFIKDDFWRNFLSVAQDSEIDSRWLPDSGVGEERPDSSIPDPVPLSMESAEEAGRFVGSRFSTARKISAASAEQAEVLARWFWQPAIENRPEIEGEPEPVGREWSLERYRAAARAAGRDVIDISGALDGIEQPLYWDQFHTNEQGAKVIGRRMYAELRDDLAGLQDRRR